MKRHDQYFVYILEDKNGAYYTGYTRDIKKRLKQHTEGLGGEYTKNRLPVKLVYTKEYKYYENAFKAEKRYKRMTRKRKEAIIKIYQANKGPRCFTS